MSDLVFDDDNLRVLYERAVELPNKNAPLKGFIRCPECGEEILMIPTLRVMSEAIENHVRKHEEHLKLNPIKAHQTAILVRLSLMSQVLEQSCKPHLS